MNFVISSVLERTQIHHRIDCQHSNDVSANISCSCRSRKMWNQILFFPSADTSTQYEMPVHRLLGCRMAAPFPRQERMPTEFLFGLECEQVRVRWRAGDLHDFDVGRKSWNFQFKFVENSRKSFKLTGGGHSIYQMHVILLCHLLRCQNARATNTEIQRQKKQKWKLECEID